MAEGLNRVILIGNLGKEPELRFTQKNMGVLSLRMGTSESFYSKDTKERTSKTEWHNVIVWGKRGEALNKILSKGSKLCVEGRLQTRDYLDKQGAKQYRTEIVADNVVLLGSKPGAADGEAPTGGYAGAPSDYTEGFGGGADDDEIPF